MAKRILVVDDDENILSLERTILEQKGFHVTTAAGGEEALKQLREQSFDLLRVVGEVIVTLRDELDLATVHATLAVDHVEVGLRALERGPVRTVQRVRHRGHPAHTHLGRCDPRIGGRPACGARRGHPDTDTCRHGNRDRDERVPTGPNPHLDDPPVPQDLTYV